MMNRNLTVVIQAGGRSSRMGRDKALVELGGKPLIEHIIDRVSNLADDIVIITNNRPSFIQYGLRLVSDKDPGAGALPGLHTALKSATSDYVLLIACDMPFVNQELLKHQVHIAFNHHADVVIPLWQERLQTMHAVYRTETCIPAVEQALANDEKRMVSFHNDVLVRILQPEELVHYSPHGRTFLNINTPEELEHAHTLL